MDRPFCLVNNVIAVFHFKISYTTENNDEKIIMALQRKQADYEVEQLAEQGITDISIEELDTSQYEWMDGIDVGSSRSMERAQKIWQMGEAAYLEELNQPTEADYLVELDYRLSKLELGV